MLYFPAYLALFFWAERVEREDYYLSHCFLDDWIPLAPQFVYVYVLWYPLMLGMALYLLYARRDAFCRYARAVILGLTLSIAIFFLFPSAQALRPEVLPDTGCSAALLKMIYAADTNTNVLPSMHVVGTLAAMAAAFDGARTSKPALGRAARWGVLALGLLINASTVLIKQHSALDVFAGVALFAPIYLAIYILPARRRRKSK